MDIPRSASDLSLAWLQEVLPGDAIKSLSVTRIGEDYGYASEIYQCTFRSKGNPKSVVAKIWRMTESSGVEEIQFYENFNLGLNAPRQFFGAHDEKIAVLVLEDLQDADQGDVLSPLNLERGRRLATCLAELHGRRIERAELAAIPWLGRQSHWSLNNLAQRRSEFIERFPSTLSPEAMTLLNLMEYAPAVSNDRLRDAPVTLVHGDFHLDNVMFRPTGEPVLLDWSRPQLGSTITNLAELLFSMVKIADVDLVLDAYVETFTRISDIPCVKETIERQLGGAFLRHFYQATCGVVGWHPSHPRGKAIIDAGIQRANDNVAFWRGRDPELLRLPENYPSAENWRTLS